MGQFDSDILANKGYLYTTRASVSSKLANERLTQVTEAILKDIEGKRVIDVGCGDGTYTFQIYKWGRPRQMIGIDAILGAIDIATKRYAFGRADLIFKVASCYKIPFPEKSFDIAIVRGLLHHLDKPAFGLKEISRVANKVLIIDPNGFNPILKLIEKISPYHRKHGEKSYTPVTLRKWSKALHGKIIEESYAGLVPFFFPKVLAVFLKKIEPFFEKTPLIKSIFCGVYINYSSYNQ